MNRRPHATTRRLPTAIASLVAIVLAACASPGSSSPSSTSGAPGATSPGGIPATSPAASGRLSDTELKIRLIDRFGALWYCDPDFWPVAREDEQALAIQRWAEVSADAAVVSTIAAHLGVVLTPTPTDSHKLAIYREWKVLRAIALQPAGADRYGFDFLATPPAGQREGTRSDGTIDRSGVITVTTTTPAPEPVCPICLAKGQRVDTPLGAVPVESLQLGDPVWTLDTDGRRVTGTVIAVGSARVPAGHEMVRLTMADARSLLASPGHPVLDGRRLAVLRPGDLLDGIVVTAADRVPHVESETFDLLPSGPIGAYSIDGIWLRSTLSN